MNLTAHVVHNTHIAFIFVHIEFIFVLLFCAQRSFANQYMLLSSVHKSFIKYIIRLFTLHCISEHTSLLFTLHYGAQVIIQWYCFSDGVTFAVQPKLPGKLYFIFSFQCSSFFQCPQASLRVVHGSHSSLCSALCSGDRCIALQFSHLTDAMVPCNMQVPPHTSLVPTVMSTTGLDIIFTNCTVLLVLHFQVLF